MRYLSPLIFCFCIMHINLYAQNCPQAKKILKKQIIAFSNGFPPPKVKINSHSCFRKKGNKKFKAYYNILKAYYLCEDENINLRTLVSLHQEAVSIVTNKPNFLSNIFTPKQTMGFKKIAESVQQCINSRISKEENYQQTEAAEDNLKDLIPLGCILPDINSKPANEGIDQIFYLDAFMCDGEFTYGDRLHLGQIGFPFMYDTFAVFMNNSIVNDYKKRQLLTHPEALSNIHITIEGHTDKVPASQLNYNQGSFSVPQGTTYKYEEYNYNTKTKEQSKTLSNTLTDQLEGNEQLGLVRAYIAKKIIEYRNITSNPIILKSIHHTQQEGKHFRKAKIIIKIDSFYSNTHYQIVQQIANDIEGLGNEVYIDNKPYLIQDNIVVKGQQYHIKFNFAHNSPNRSLPTVTIYSQGKKVYNYTIKSDLGECTSLQDQDCQIIGKSNPNLNMINYTLYIAGTKESSSIPFTPNENKL